MGKYSDEKSNRIYLKDLLEQGIHFDEVSEFKDSFFAEVYANAVDAVEKIVSDNRKNSKGLCQGRKDQRVTTTSNVISFIGRRGTGKSSVMISFQDALRRYSSDSYQCQKYNNITFKNEADMGNVRFFSLDYIDASVLEESEDIFILVLANMLNYLYALKNFNDDYNDNAKRELISAFERIYEEFLTLKNSRQDRDGVYSSFETLINVASSQRIRERFYKLVQQFIKYIHTSTGERKEECYMVISIDDLDMAHYNTQNSNKTKSRINNKSYEIVNSIHKYFSIPGVIVLTAYNYENLMLQSEKFFIDSDKTASDKGHEKESQQMNSSKLASQFVDKVFPASYRVYLPSWKKNDFGSSSVRIDVLNGVSEDNVIKKYVGMTDHTLSVKKFILLLYAEKANIFFDPFGKKIHFLEPDSLRKLADIVALFDGVKKNYDFDIINDENLQRQKILKKIKSDTYFRFVQEKLFLTEERVYFSELQEHRIDRRSQIIVKEFCGKIPCLGKMVKKDIERYKTNAEAVLLKNEYLFADVDSIIAKKEDNSNVKYSLAEFIHCIYHMTRSKEKYSKEMVACILNSYTVHLSELFAIYQNEKRKMGLEEYELYIDKKNLYNRRLDEIREVFNELIGESICGKWTEYFFPETYSIVPGSVDKSKEVSEGVILGSARVTAAANKLTIVSSKEWENLIETFVMVAMFYLDILEWNELEIEEIKGNEHSAKSIRIQVPKNSQRIEMTGFLKFSFMYPEYLEKVERLLINAIQEYPDFREKDKVMGCIKRTVNEIRRRYIRWDYEYSSMMLPIYNFDLIYNMIKRLYQKTVKKDRIVQINTGKDFLRELKDMNALFINYLEDVDAYYHLNRKLSFRVTFEKCPYVRWLEWVENEKDITDSIGYIIKNMILDVATTYGLERGADDTKMVDIDNI